MCGIKQSEGEGSETKGHDARSVRLCLRGATVLSPVLAVDFLQEVAAWPDVVEGTGR